MNSKERVLTTLSHQEPDYVPVGEWGIDHDHVSAILGRHTYWRNRKDLTIALWQGRRDQAVESKKRDYAELIDTLDYDILPVHLVPAKGPAPVDPPQLVAEGVWRDKAGNEYRYCPANDSISHMTRPPAKESLTDAEIDAYAAALAAPIDESRWELVDFICERYGKTHAVTFRGLGVGAITGPFGGDEAHQLMIPLINPEQIKIISNLVIAYNNRLIDQCARRGVSIVMVGMDYGSSKGCIMSPKVIRDLFMPPKKAIVDHAKSLGLPTMFHCCGNVWEIMDDWVATGAVGYQSIQSTAGMDLARMKSQYGHKLTLWAGVQCETLIEGSLTDVENEVRNFMSICKPGGGFIFGSTNSVQFGARTENYLKALEIYRQYRNY